MRYSQKHSSNLFSFSALIFLDLPIHTFSSSPCWETAILCKQGCQHSPSCIVNPYKAVCNISVSNSHSRHRALQFWCKIVERNENKSDFYLPRGKILPVSHWPWTDDLWRADAKWYSPWTKSCWPLESQRWRPVNGPLLSSSFDDFADRHKHPMEAEQAMTPWTTAGKCSLLWVVH